MNLPNKLTMFRVVLVPFFVLFLLLPCFQTTLGSLIALVIFVVASLTDMLDGKIARKYNLITNFGKFMDPLADKLLVCSAMICMVKLNEIAAWVVIVIIAREFIISGFRLIAADNRIVIAASMWGKVKTVFQMALIILILLKLILFGANTGTGFLSGSTAGGLFVAVPTGVVTAVNVFIAIVTYITLILTVVSLIDYIIKNKQVLHEEG
jgi:CDP-diacylglycerol--glycerol-3-phosphate 3-phosphatidyltransferase